MREDGEARRRGSQPPNEDCGPASTSGAAHTHGQYMPFFVTLGSHAYLVKSSVSSLDELENLYIGAFHMGSWRRYLKRRTKDGFPIRPALFAVFVDGLPGVPTVGGPLDEPCGEWRQLQHISELHEGCVVTPMHLAWRAIARVSIERGKDARRPCHHIRGPQSSLERLTQNLRIFLNEPNSSFLARTWSQLVLAAILVSSFSFVISTLPQYYSGSVGCSNSAFSYIEVTCIAFFTLEYALRILVSPNPAMFVIQPMNLIDLAAILPFYITIGLPCNSGVPGLQFLRILRLMRVFRLFRVSRGTLTILTETIVQSAHPIWILIFMLSMLVAVAGSITWYTEATDFDEVAEQWLRQNGYRCPAECPSDPREFLNGMWSDCTAPGDTVTLILGTKVSSSCETNMEPSPFNSILQSLWWALVTCTTVGYGDIVPVTPLGKFFGSLTMLTGLLVISLPVSVVGTRFMELYTKQGGHTTKALRNLEMEMEPDEQWLPRRPGSVGRSSCTSDNLSVCEERLARRTAKY